MLCYSEIEDSVNAELLSSNYNTQNIVSLWDSCCRRREHSTSTRSWNVPRLVPLEIAGKDAASVFSLCLSCPGRVSLWQVFCWRELNYICKVISEQMGTEVSESSQWLFFFFWNFLPISEEGTGGNTFCISLFSKWDGSCYHLQLTWAHFHIFKPLKCHLN